MLALLVGIPLGSFAGLVAGSYLFAGKSFLQPRHFSNLDVSVDALDDVEVVDHTGESVPPQKKAFLQDLSPALVYPDYQRTLFVNSILTILWPQLGPAVYKEVIKQAKQPLEVVKAKFKWLESVDINDFDLGSRPFRLDSVRTLATQEDELILEAPLFWGGSLSVKLHAGLRLGPYALVVPVHVANIQLKALARVTITPLVETLPCVGGITISLMEEPHVDCELRVGPSPDLMALPGVPEAVKLAIKMFVGKMLVYPNQLSVPIMENFGVPPPPVGMLRVKVLGATDLASSFWDTVDPFVTMEVREGRPKTTQTIMNNPNPTWNEEFEFVVDDVARQSLKLLVQDFDVVSSDLVGTAVVPFEGADFVQHPRVPVRISLSLMPPTKDGTLAKSFGSSLSGAKSLGNGVLGAATTAAGAATGVASATTAGAAGLGTQSASVSGAPPSPSPAASVATTPRAQPPSALEQIPPGQGAKTAEDRLPSPASSGGKPHHHSFLGGIFKKKKKRASGELTPSDTPRSPSSPSAGAPSGPASPSSATKSGFLGALKPSSRKSSGQAKKNRSVPDRGQLHLEVTFLPFKDAELEGLRVPGAGAGQPTHPSAQKPAEIMQAAGRGRRLNRLTTLAMRRKARGVLTVNLKKCSGLEDSANSYVQLSLFDTETQSRQVYETPVVLNEASPRYEYKTDFVNISTHSVLSCFVFNRPELGSMFGKGMGKVKSLFGSEQKPKPVGTVRVNVEEVVREGRMKDVWPLQEAEAGEMHMTLEWKVIEFDEDALEGDDDC